MGVFSIIETFIFFSLAISFILILLLVYHFKGRMAKLEQKTDTMVGIINDIAKELANVGQRTTDAAASASCPFPGPLPPMPPPMSFMMNLGGGIGPDPFTTFMSVPSSSQPDVSDKVEEIDQDDTDSDDTDSDDDDDTDREDDNVPTKIDLAEVEPIENPVLDIVDIDESVPQEEPQPEPQPEPEPEPESHEKDYRKMGIQALRQEVIQESLASEKDANKMKKNELLHLLGALP